MNRNKIKGLILTLGAVTAIGLGGNTTLAYAKESTSVTAVTAAAQPAKSEKDNAIERINKGMGTATDYRNSLGIRDIASSEQVDFVNKAIKEAAIRKGSNLDSDEIWEIAPVSAKIESLYEHIADDDAGIEDYDDAEFKHVDETNVDIFNKYFSENQYYLYDDMQDYIDNFNDLYEKICSGEGTVEDYKSLGITEGISVDSIEYVNKAVKASAEAKGDKLTIEEITNAVKTISKKFEVINRINTGNGSLEDYASFAVKGVDKSNLSYINSQIIGKVNEKGTNIQKEVDDILFAYRFIAAVNKGSETKDENGLVKEYLELAKVSVEYDTSSDSELTVIRRCIEIKRKLEGDRDLTKSEITSIINSVDSNLEDAIVMTAKIDEAVEEKESLLERDLSNEEKQILIDNIIKERKYAVRRIFVGNGTVEDFHNFGEYKVNHRNIEAINRDIRDFRKVNKLSYYRLEGLKEEVAEGIAIYNINRDNLTKNKDGIVKEYALLGKEVPYDFNSTSIFRVTQDYIILMKKQDNKLSLGRQEILDVFNEVELNLDKYKLLMPKISDAVFMAENEKGENLTADEINEIVNDVEGDLKAVVSRLVLGKAAIEDYKLFGEDRVTSQNINTINSDIAENGGITKTSNYGVNGLKEAVDKGIALYNLNNGIETAALNGNVKELETLGLITESSNEKDSIDKQVMKEIQDRKDLAGGKYLNRQAIQVLFEEVKEKKTNPPKEPEEKKGNVVVDYDINNWRYGYQISFKITNKSDSPINKWAIKLSRHEIKIEKSWNVNIMEAGQCYLLTPVVWNSCIDKGASVDFGIQGSGSIKDTITYILV